MPWSIWKRAIQTLGRRYLQTAAKNDRPLRLAVIGAGPAGFYTAYRVLSKLQNSKVDMYESLPVPYGLVRFGVAPDHPEVKVWPSLLPLHNPDYLAEDLNLELSRQIQRNRLRPPFHLYWQHSHRNLLATPSTPITASNNTSSTLRRIASLVWRKQGPGARDSG